MSKTNVTLYRYADSAAPGSELQEKFENDDAAVNWAQKKFDGSLARMGTLYCIENGKQAIVAEFEE